MDIKSDRSNEVIIRALDALSNQVDTSNKTDNEKKILKLLTMRMKEYFLKKLSSLSDSSLERLFNLQSYMTGIIVDINSSLKDEADLASYAGKLNDVLHDKELTHLVSKQKLLNYKLR